MVGLREREREREEREEGVKNGGNWWGGVDEVGENGR